MTPLDRAIEAFSFEYDPAFPETMSPAMRAAILALATPEAIPDAAVEAFRVESAMPDRTTNPEAIKLGLAAALRVMAEGK
jgi:hypothetical protein